MKKIFILFLLLSTILTAYSQKNKKKSAKVEPVVFSLQTRDDSLAYAVGVLNYQSLKNELIESYGLKINMEILTRAMMDASKDTSLLQPQDANDFLGLCMSDIMEQQSNEAKSAGEAFLAENKNKAGVVTTQSGLQYEILELGNGVKPVATDRVKVHYTGTLIDGTEFDSSVERGEPVVFTLNQVIPGWTEGLQLMPVGSKFRFYIPSGLAYGARAAGPTIKPYSVLIFDVNLLGIEN
ncbi:MAG: FKBP-type peptidyl-prolyl cis-trans isomerase [Bacteroidales bacterium]|nr:FKBP-type peptidyl-prolyl cis-trans isomerase [Bacteroidales bacterium]MCB8998455.1 FKBP-type peptidyl-prolyl cis-trans isomerase [Bacteroidales bacterium]MCB9012898.1 FKBP-type peptidyl-prolyl cis-trans isomerase [Bacteroidales bacterium]